MSSATAEEIRRAIVLRANSLEETARRLRGAVNPGRRSLRAALELVESFPSALLQVLSETWDRNTRADVRISTLTPFLRQTNIVANFVEGYLTHGTHLELSPALEDEVRGELDSLELFDYGVVLAHGEAHNFSTVFGDVAAVIYNPLVHLIPRPDSLRLALFRVPRYEGSGVLWRPILVGHEVAHIAVHEYNGLKSFDLTKKFDYAEAAGIPSPGADLEASDLERQKALFEISESWATEFLCDARALYRYGPAAISAFGDYFMAIGAMDVISTTHPPGVLRLRVLLKLLESVAGPATTRMIQPWEGATPANVAMSIEWVDHLADLFASATDDLWKTVLGFPGDQYDHQDRSPIVAATSKEFENGVPGREIVEASGTYTAVTNADVVNAAWAARFSDAPTPYEDLAQKALQSLDFLRRWTNKGGVLPLGLHKKIDSTDSETKGALSAAAITGRLRRSDRFSLVATPLLQSPKGAALDLRLGNRFIAFKRSSISSFDPLRLEDDPRSIQSYEELTWSDKFILHPLELVLGCTLEYLVLPPDLTAQVVTRSSYGRLGLLSATAVQVHPNFKGCLTLELVNLSTIPLALSPGERIAQLVLSRTDEVEVEEDDKYVCPTGPQFSRVRDDDEANVLRNIARLD